MNVSSQVFGASEASDWCTKHAILNSTRQDMCIDRKSVRLTCAVKTLHVCLLVGLSGEEMILCQSPMIYDPVTENCAPLQTDCSIVCSKQAFEHDPHLCDKCTGKLFSGKQLSSSVINVFMAV